MLDEVLAVADRVSILRDGRNVVERPVSQISRSEMIEKMVGRELSEEFPSRPANIGKLRLEVSGLRRGNAVRDVSLCVHSGEIVGLAGLVGAGRTELVRLIFGADDREAGEIRLDGNLLAIRSPREAINAGIGLLTEDRKLQGLVLPHSVRDNFALPNLDRLSRRGFVQSQPEREEFGNYVKILVMHEGRMTGEIADARRSTQEEIMKLAIA